VAVKVVRAKVQRGAVGLNDKTNTWGKRSKRVVSSGAKKTARTRRRWVPIPQIDLSILNYAGEAQERGTEPERGSKGGGSGLHCGRSHSSIISRKMLCQGRGEAERWREREKEKKVGERFPNKGGALRGNGEKNPS